MHSTPATSSASPASRQLEAVSCPKCGELASDAMRHCATCGHDLGSPNVRAACSPAEVAALDQRFREAKARAVARGLDAEFDSLHNHMRTSSHVVVAMPPLYARTFLSDPRTLYTGYEALVGTPTRMPAPFAHDSDRHAVGGKLFGSFAHEIRYGVLSLDGKGLSAYGIVFVRLRDITVQDRVSFLEENSYILLDGLQATVRGAVPLGLRCGWSNRCDLAVVKVEPALTAGSAAPDWSRQLVVSGSTRADDRCIEAHIFGPFNVGAVDGITFAGQGATREERNDIKVIKEFWAKRSLPGGAA